ncbi:MAG: hypothetical protein AAGB31_12850 [Bdellovibrio sp.]
MADENEPLPWDYFLTDYERDLLRLPIEDALRKHPSISREQMESDLVKIQENQARFEQDNGQN